MESPLSNTVDRVGAVPTIGTEVVVAQPQLIQTLYRRAMQLLETQHRVDFRIQNKLIGHITEGPNGSLCIWCAMQISDVSSAEILWEISADGELLSGLCLPYAIGRPEDAFKPTPSVLTPTLTILILQSIGSDDACFGLDDGETTEVRTRTPTNSEETSMNPLGMIARTVQSMARTAWQGLTF